LNKSTGGNVYVNVAHENGCGAILETIVNKSTGGNVYVDVTNEDLDRAIHLKLY
jgi:hypothetical protein